MKVLITGAGGQVGWELARWAPTEIEVRALDRGALDITEADAVLACVETERPDVILNAAAYTAVDRAESEPDAAYAVNEAGARHLATAAARLGARLIHISTDFVFDGNASAPYRPADRPNPLSVYGGSKLAGERAVQEVLGEAALIVRTSWVYSAHGQNFVRTMLRLMRERDDLQVVDDQIGTPSWAGSLAQGLWALARADAGGILHLGDAGVASWYDFAVAIAEEASALGLIPRAIPIAPIATIAYPTPARRPAWSVLDKREGWHRAGIPPLHWRAALRLMLGDVKRNEKETGAMDA